MGIRNIPVLLWTCAVITLTIPDETHSLQMACSYGERGSLTVYCVNATSMFFKLVSYRFDHLDETLKCVNCSLTTVSPGTFDISGNQIKTLDIRNSSVQAIWPKAFIGLIFMERLLLSDNTITSIQPGAFIGIWKVRYLEMKNTVSALEPYVFRELQLLEVLDLSWSNLMQLVQNTFAGLKSLKILDLSFNKLRIIEDSFTPLVSLRALRLQGNKILKISGGEFSNLLSLYQLNLEGNDLINFTLNMDPSNHLRTLNLGKNRLTSDGIKIGAFKNLNNLEDLDLKKNLFTKIPPKFFQGLFRLRNLNLYANQIKEFSTGTFSGLPHLIYLNLSSNNLQTARITGRLLLHSLHTLDLSNNHISEFDYITFIASMPRITHINLLHNNLSCNVAAEIETLFQEDHIRFYMSNDKDVQMCETVPKSAKEIIQELIDEKYKDSSNAQTSEIIWIVLVCIIIILVAILFYIQFFVLYRVPRKSLNIRIMNSPSTST